MLKLVFQQECLRKQQPDEQLTGPVQPEGHSPLKLRQRHLA